MPVTLFSVFIKTFQKLLNGWHCELIFSINSYNTKSLRRCFQINLALHHFICSNVNTNSSRSAKLNITCMRFYYLCVCDHIELLTEFLQGTNFHRLLGSRLVGAAEVRQHHVKCSNGIKIWQHFFSLQALRQSLQTGTDCHLVLLKANLQFLLVLACFSLYTVLSFFLPVDKIWIFRIDGETQGKKGMVHVI